MNCKFTSSDQFCIKFVAPICVLLAGVLGAWITGSYTLGATQQQIKSNKTMNIINSFPKNAYSLDTALENYRKIIYEASAMSDSSLGKETIMPEKIHKATRELTFSLDILDLSLSGLGIDEFKDDFNQLRMLLKSIQEIIKHQAYPNGYDVENFMSVKIQRALNSFKSLQDKLIESSRNKLKDVISKEATKV